MSKLYSVLTVIFGDYEQVREVQNPSPIVEYVLVTDNPSLRSRTWNIQYWDCPFDLNNVSKYMYVKWHPFEFVNTNTMIWLDGSVQILDDFSQALMFDFIGSDTSIAETFNIIQNNCRDEIKRWMIGWGTKEEPKPFYDYSTGQKTLDFFDEKKFDLNENQGMVQTTIYMCKNNKLSNYVNSITWNLLMQIGGKQTDRQSMSLRTYAVTMYTKPEDVMIMSASIMWSKYFDYRFHNSEQSQKESFINKTVYYPEDYHVLLDRYFYFHGKLVAPKVLEY